MGNLSIAIDKGPLTSGDSIRGIGTYTRELIKSLGLHGVDVSNSDLDSYDIVHLTRFHPFFISVPFNKPKNSKLVLTVYDLIPLLYPLAYKPGVKGKLCWELNKLLIKKNVDAIITISETSKKDICRFMGINPNKVFVTYLAQSNFYKKVNLSKNQSDSLKEKYNLPDKFVLYVGDLNFNKNTPFLINACKQAGVNLVICGKQAVQVDSMDLNHPELEHLKEVDWNGVTRLGFVPDSDLNLIFNLATLYVQPSLYEGFGIPVLDAFAAGCPVVCAKTQALVEIAEGAAMFADPKNITEFSLKIKSVYQSSKIREDLVAKGFKKVKDYSWDRTAINTKKVYAQI